MTHPNCKCSLRTRLAGDGCQWCNPTLTADHVLEQLAELRAYKERTEAALRELCERVTDHGACVACYKLLALGLWRDKEQGK